MAGYGLEEKLVAAGVVMEAFGNAQTSRNKNSSRFGKYLKIHFSASGRVQGATAQVYLLEKSRVIHQDVGERNYHIFYQFLASATQEQREAFKLKSPSLYTVLNKGNTLKIQGVDDREEYRKLVNALDLLGITAREKESLMKLLAALLSLGNITFSQDEAEKAYLDEDESLDPSLAMEDCPLNEALLTAAELLEEDPKELSTALILRSMRGSTSKSSFYFIPFTRLQAQENRDTLIKTVYHLAFQWIINRMNLELDADEDGSTFMGILDIFGFEIFDKNRFEQLCINYCNERLQSFFNVNIFEYEQKECQREGVMLESVVFSDNRDCVSLIDDRPLGILAMLDEEGALPGGTDSTLISKYHDKFAKHPKFKKVDPRKKQKEFCVVHYAGDVSYEITGFIDRNRTTINPDILDIMENSGNSFLSDLFIQYQARQAAALTEKKKDKEKRKSGSGKSDLKKMPHIGEVKRASFLKSGTSGSIATTFKEQLNELMDNIAQTTPHYVRCICSNYQQVPMTFDSAVVLHQLNCAGILDCVRIRMLGYPIRRPYLSFIARYKYFMDKSLLKNPDDKAVVQQFFDKEATGDLRGLYQFGTTKVFMKDKISRILEDRRVQVLGRVVVPIQRAYRAYIDRIHYQELREAVEVVQQVARQTAAVGAFRKLRAITLQRLERERREREERERKEHEERERREQEERERREQEERERREREERERREREEREQREREERERKEREARERMQREEREQMESQERAAKEKKDLEERVAQEKKDLEERVARERKEAEENTARERREAEENAARERREAEERATRETLEAEAALRQQENENAERLARENQMATAEQERRELIMKKMYPSIPF